MNTGSTTRAKAPIFAQLKTINTEIPGKADLARDRTLCAFEGVAFDPEMATKNGITAAATFTLTILDGPLAGRRDERRREFGAVAKAIAAVPAGTVGVGRYALRGGGFGIEWSEDPEDFAAAEAALAPPPF